MGRKSLEKERVEQILNAFEKCIINFGIEGATVSAIAREADLSRTLVHHFAGKRDALIAAFAERVMQHNEQELADFRKWLPKKNRLDALLQMLFAPRDTPTTEQAMYSLLQSDNATYAPLSEAANKSMINWQTLIAEELHACGKGSSPKDCTSAAFALLSLIAGYSYLRDMPDASAHHNSIMQLARHAVDNIGT